MKKRGLYAAGAVVAIILLVLIVVPFLINANSFRPKIEAELQSSLARKVEIGDLRLSLLAGGVTARNITIADDPRFSQSPFVRAKSLEVRVEMARLIFSRSLRITGITLVEPELTLLRSPSATWNFSSLGAGKKAGKSSSAGTSDLSIQKLRVVNGRVTVGGSPARGKPTTYEAVNLTAHNVAYDSQIPFTFQAKTPGGGSVKVEGIAGPIDRSDASLTPLTAKVDVQHMDLASTGIVEGSPGLGGSLAYDGALRSDGRLLHSEGTAKVEKLRLVRAGSPAAAPVSLNYATDYDLHRQAGTLSKGEVQTGSSTVRLSGTYDTRGESMLVHLKLNGSQLPVRDIQGLLPALGIVLPAGASLQGGNANADLTLDGAVERLVTTGTISLSNTRLAGFNLASKLSAISALAGTKSEADTVIQSLSSDLRVAPEGIRAENVNLVVPALGSVAGSGTISANNTLNFRMVARLASANSPLGQMTSRIPILGGGAGGGTIPFLIQGTTAQPIFVPDVAGAVAGGLKSGGQQKQQPGNQGLGDVLQGIFGKKQ